MQTNKFLIKKSNFCVHQKRFSDKYISYKLGKNINSCLLRISKTSPLIKNSNNLNIKTSLYLLSKVLKNYKRLNTNIINNFSLKDIDKFSLSLQISGFYNSEVEKNKKKQLAKTRAKILNFYIYCLLKQYNKNNICFLSKKFSKAYAAKEGYKFFYSTLKVPKFGVLSKRLQFLQKKSSLLVLRKKYTKILESRLFLYLKIQKKRYKPVMKNLILNKLKIKQLFNLFSKTKKKFVLEKKEFYFLYKKLVWKRKKRRNRKKTGFFYFLRRRRRMLYNYYIPRHLEINYKTFDVAHLGKFDLPTTNSRITFWLNLRRLLTFLSL